LYPTKPGCLVCGRREDQEGMEDWDQDKLEEVVNQKHGTEKPTNKTDIICKFFLDAVESKLYGWSASRPLSSFTTLCASARLPLPSISAQAPFNVTCMQA
jgi:hypothetical protein